MPLSLAALDDLFEAFEDLRDVLDGTDAVAIDIASNRVAHAAQAVRAIGAWRSDAAVLARLNAMLPMLNSARIRVNLLADHANQRLSMLSAHGSSHAPLTYGR
ncbi:hypothetical protein [Sphingobium sp.]|uniref:hypothetical protein n=1 Tax=Sphingobium sp. TaxID=1912891 RepID=UPI003BB69381